MPDSVELLLNGAVVKTFSPQFFYTDFVDTSQVSEGQATLQARATVAGVSRSGNTVNIIVDRTAPLVSEVTPATTVLVGSDTEFKLTFNEPVYSPTFNYNDVVILSVLLPGAATPTRIDANIVVSNSDSVLTIKPRGLVRFGVLSLSWLGLRDAAGNNVAGTFANTWAVKRATLVGAGFPTDFFAYAGARGFAGIAVGVGGELFGLSKVADSGNLQLFRFDAATNAWSPLGPAINERPVDASHLGELAVDASGVPHVAFAQTSAPPTTPPRFELVLRKLVNGAWQDAALAAPMVAGGVSRPQDFSMTKLLFDASGRAVVAVTEANVGPLKVFRQQGGAMVALGTPLQARNTIDLGLQNNGEPVVSGISSARFVQSWDGTNWVTQGPPEPSGRTFNNQLAVVNGEIWSAFQNASSNVSVERLTNGIWVDVPLPQVQRYGGTLALSVFQGNPVLAVFGGAQGQVTVYRFIGNRWEDGFEASTEASPFGQPRLRLVTTTDKVFLVQNRQFLSTVQELAFP